MEIGQCPLAASSTERKIIVSATTLVVVAHPEPRSFTGSWAHASIAASEKSGHTVLLSDLVTDRFNPVESALCYATNSDPLFDPLKAQEQAAAAGELPADVAAEMQKIIVADRIIVHFPIWWFGPPAILKGWLDRCLVHGGLHTVDQRFDAGQCRSKKVLFCVSTGATEVECSMNGKEGNLDMLLWPLAYTFRYLGFEVLQPQAVHGVHGYFEGAEEAALQGKLAKVLDDHTAVIAQFDKQPLMAFNADTDFDDAGRLKTDAISHSAFIRHSD